MKAKEFYRTVMGIRSNDILDKLVKYSKSKKVKKGEMIQAVGDTCSYTSFLVSGLFRGYFLDGNGNDVTDCFAYLPGTPLVSSLGITGPSVVYIEALENSEIIIIKTAVINELVNTQMELAGLYSRLLSNALQMHWENKVAVTNHTAKARYMWFQDRFPGLIHRVSHKYIASFLGMTPVTLSRVRKSIRDAQNQEPEIES